MCQQKTHFRPKYTCKLKVSGWRTIQHKKKARAATRASDKLGFTFF